jgi:hypothetical protein
MTMYNRSPSADFAVATEWDRGLSWLSHPRETARRASHAVVGDGGGVWLFDPLDAAGIDDAVAELGPVAGVAVLSAYHARDADAFAARHGVPVSIPRWLPRVADRVDAPVDRFDGRLGDSGFRVRELAPFPGWSEGVAHRPSDGTLYVPESLGTASPYTVGDERLGLYLAQRLLTPRFLLDYDPERVLVGHGEPVSRAATAALRDAVENGRRRLPRALRENGLSQVRAAVTAMAE